MATLTSSATLTVGAGAVEAESVTLAVLPIAAPGEGTGRLVHPTLGTLDYDTPPDEWTGLDGDALVPPVWASVATLDGAANTLWPGALRDVVCEERWLAEGGLSMKLAQLRALLSFWATPPDPASAYVTWYPSYTSALAFQVVLLGVEVAGQPLTLNHLALRAEWVPYPVTVRLRLVGRPS